MTATVDASAIAALPLAPPNPLPYRQRLAEARDATAGVQRLCAAGGPVTRVTLGPRRLTPTLVYVSSPQGARDVLARRDGGTDRAALPVMKELRYVVGANLLNLDHEHWVPRRRAMQPIFAKHNVTQFGTHIVDATEDLSGQWQAGAEVDVAEGIRALTLRALSRSLLGRDLGAEGQAVGAAMHAAFMWVVSRSTAPARVPAWLATPAQRRAHHGQRADTPVRSRGPQGLPGKPRPRCSDRAGADRGPRSGHPKRIVRQRYLRRADDAPVRWP